MSAHANTPMSITSTRTASMRITCGGVVRDGEAMSPLWEHLHVDPRTSGGYSV